MSRRPARTATLLAVGGLLATALTSCAAGASDRPGAVLDGIRARQQAGSAVTPPPAASASTCTSPVPDEASYPGLASVPSTLPAGSLEAAIKQRGYLVVGVSGDTRLLGARDRLTEADPAGFDIDVARAIGRAILGPNARIVFKVITSAQRFPQVNLGVDHDGVDLVARAVSMTCARWAATVTDPATATGSAFSVAYLSSDQRVLVRTSEQADNLDALIKARQKAVPGSTVKVCAPSPSTSLDKIRTISGVTPVPVSLHSDCLALWQEGRVDAITGDDVILAGFLAKDSTARILPGTRLGTTPYGLAIARAHPEFVRYVNAVMATAQFRAAWQQAYDTNLAKALVDAPKVLPPPVESRPLPGTGG